MPPNKVQTYDILDLTTLYRHGNLKNLEIRKTRQNVVKHHKEGKESCFMTKDSPKRSFLQIYIH